MLHTSQTLSAFFTHSPPMSSFLFDHNYSRQLDAFRGGIGPADMLRPHDRFSNSRDLCHGGSTMVNEYILCIRLLFALLHLCFGMVVVCFVIIVNSRNLDVENFCA